MSQDTFLIAPLRSGLVTDKAAWQIPEDAFARLNNAYIHEGKIRKRFGSTLTAEKQIFSRLRIYLGKTDTSGEFGISGAENAPGKKWKVGQQFLITNGIDALEVFTVITVGAEKAMLSTGNATIKKFSTTDGRIKLSTSHEEKDVYFYPADPVTGITHYETGEPNNSPTFAFDTQFIYEKSVSGWGRSGTDAAKLVTLHGADHKFISSQNWLGLELHTTELYITNNNATIGTPGVNDDPMYSYDGTDWKEFRPVFNVERAVAPATVDVVKGFVQTAKFIKIFDGRMFLFATTENVSGVNKYYCNRVRFSFDGSPACPVTGPPQVTSYNGWLEDNKTWTGSDAVKVESGGAGWADAGTSEEIISVEFIRNRIIVYFERSTWELVPTGININLYAWHKLNSEVGSISPYSSIGFDDAILNIGSNGISVCNGVVVRQADEAIRHDVLKISNYFYGAERVYGIRDFNLDIAYWTFPSSNKPDTSNPYPNKILIFNYKENSWATADDCITCFGYSEQREADNYLPASVLAGNQQGFVYNINADVYVNAAVLQITNIQLYGVPGSRRVGLTMISHMLEDGDYIKVSSVEGVTNISGIYKLTRMNFNLVTIDVDHLDGVYTGAGYVARVSRIDILSKQWNPYVSKGSGVFISQIEFAVKKIAKVDTKGSELTVDCYPSSTTLSMIEEGTTSGALLGTGILETSPYDASPLETHQELLWHPVYLQAAGSSVQVRLFLSDTQMLDDFIAKSNLVIEALMLHTDPSSFVS